MAQQPRFKKQYITEYATAAILSFVTLGIFFFIQNNGAENTIRRFHKSIKEGDLSLTDSLVTKPKYLTHKTIILNRVSHFLKLGAKWHCRSELQKDKTVHVKVLYLFPDHSKLLTIWILENKKERWLINIDKTSKLWRRSLGIL